MSFQTPAIDPGGRRPERITVEYIENDAGPSVIVSEENSSGGLVWQRGMSVDDARSLHRALGVAIAQIE